MKSDRARSPTPLILASASPRRSELLAQIGVEFTVQAAHIDEKVAPEEPAEDYVVRMAGEKGAAVAGVVPPSTLVLSADTIVLIDNQILGKPRDYEHAMVMLEQLSGKTHTVITAVNLRCDADEVRCAVATQVTFCELNPAMRRAYLATDEPWDKAGGYGIQGTAGAFVLALDGSYSNVVGLPLAQTWQMLSRYKVPGALSRD